VDFERIEFRYVANGGGAVDLDGLRAYARANMHPSVEIAAVAVEHIARGPGGKFDQFVSLVDDLAREQRQSVDPRPD
jgi:hypothetical protein